MSNVTKLSKRSRADMDRALHGLEGILRGITIDHRINDSELGYLRTWLNAHSYLFEVEPMGSISGALHEAIEHGVLRSDTHGDLLWLIGIWSTPNQYYDDVTSDMQRLHGIMAGVAADDALTDAEVSGMEGWLADHEDLRGHWPYDDLVHHLHEVLADGVLHPEKRAAALQFLKEFGGEPAKKPVNHDAHKAKRSPWLRSENPIMTTLTGICAKDPVIEFKERNFCFTGKASSGPRAALETEVVMRGGAILGVSAKLHYLVIGAASSPCWAFATYGRKVEAVMHIREAGGVTVILHEDDFVKALEGKRHG